MKIILRITIFILAIGVLSLQATTLEENTDRPGYDYKNLGNLRDASVCQQKCQIEDRCVAWTFVKPNTIQGPKSQCYLKDRIPNKTHNTATISGLKNHNQTLQNTNTIPPIQEIYDWKNITVKGGRTDKKVQRLSPGRYYFTLIVSGQGKNPKVNFKINQKNAVAGRKQLHASKYSKGTHTGNFIIEARRVTDASGSAGARGYATPISAGGSGEGEFSANIENVNATREINFKISNGVGKRKIKYSLKIIKQ